MSTVYLSIDDEVNCSVDVELAGLEVTILVP